MARIPAAFSILAALALPLASCATQIGGSLRADGSADLAVAAALQPTMSALIMGFAAAAGMPPGTAILDGPAIALSMAGSPGISSASLRNASPTSIEGHIQSSHVGEFLAAGGTDFAVFEGMPGGGGRFAVSLDRESGRALLEMISPDVAGYLAALMAPVATGEVMTRAEYLFLVGSVYGAGIAAEISAAQIRVSVGFPGPIQSVAGGSFSGSRADFSIPLLDVLVMESPLRYEVIWRGGSAE